MNTAFRRPVVAKWMGGRSRGGAKLTPTGEKLVESYDAVLAVGGTNLTDEDFQLAHGYPEPGTSLYLRLRLNF